MTDTATKHVFIAVMVENDTLNIFQVYGELKNPPRWGKKEISEKSSYDDPNPRKG